MPKMPKFLANVNNPDGELQRPAYQSKPKASPPQLPLPYTKATTTSGKKRGRPPKPAAPYPPPPPPPPPPANNPFYQKFFDDYWAQHSYSQGNAAAAFPPPPPPGVQGPRRGKGNGVPTNSAITVSVPPMVFPPPNPTIPVTRTGELTQEEYPVKNDRETFVLATPDDHGHLSEKQCYLRSRLCEVFLSQQTDVEVSVRNRRALFVGQVGLRCVFCVPAMDSKDRVERAITYPTTTAKFYQTAQDMQHFHFNTCPAIPLQVREVYQNLKANMNSRRGDAKVSPRDYWTKCCGELGLVDYVGDDGKNAGVKLKEGHGLVPRARLPEYAKELFMPPEESKEGEEGEKVSKAKEGDADGEGEMEKVLAKEVKVDGNSGGFDELVAGLDDDEEEKMEVEDNDDEEKTEDDNNDDEEEDGDENDDDEEEDGDENDDDDEEDGDESDGGSC